MTTPVILYVDDDRDDCCLLKESFAQTGTRFICISSGEEAIKILESLDQEDLPSLIILDINMPRWDGRQTLMYLKSVPELAPIPVVILSTSDNKMDKEVCKRLGAIAYLQKPIHFDGYKKIVDQCLPLIRVSNQRTY